ncbi:MAG: methyltransferase domain-containing protein [Chloroflexi bacterium]|nr:methyltransferase domain-containing protein [Chloroflexota bacterium]
MLLTRFMRHFFQWLYHPLAFTYDLVAAAVSFGRWNDWGRGVLPHVHGTRVLEVGHGPGHLQRSLLDLGLAPVGLDESAQMGRLAKTRLLKSGYAKINLVRGVTQSLPFPSGHFDTILSTFPSEYIFDPQTLSEVWRVLDNGGRLVVLPAAWPRNPLLGWLFRVTGQSPAEALEIIQGRLKNPFIESGFDVEIQTLDVQSGLLLIIIATK